MKRIAAAFYVIALVLLPAVYANFQVLRSIEEVTSSVETSRKFQLLLLVSSKKNPQAQDVGESSESLTADDESVNALVTSQFPHVEKIVSGFDGIVECVIADIKDTKAIAKKWNIPSLPAVVVYRDVPTINPYTKKLYRTSEVLNVEIMQKPSILKKALKELIPSTYVTEWNSDHSFNTLLDIETWIKTKHQEDKTVIVLVSKQKTVSHLYRAVSVQMEELGLAFAYLRKDDTASSDIIKKWQLNEFPALIAIPKDGSDRVLLDKAEEMKTYAHLQAFVQPFATAPTNKENRETKKKTGEASDKWFITGDKFDKHVLSSNLIWIISFLDPETEKSPDLTKQLKKHMNELQKKSGILAVAGVKCGQPENADLCTRFGYDPVKGATVVRVFPIALTNGRRPEVTRADVLPDSFHTIDEAKTVATTIIPDRQVHVMTAATALNEFINRALVKKTMPIVLVTSKQEIPAMFKALSVSLAAQNVVFGVVPAQDPQIRLQFSLPDATTTALLCLVQVEDSAERPPNSAPFGVLAYDKKVMGPYSYQNIARFVMSVLTQYPHPFDDTITDEDEPTESTFVMPDGPTVAVPYLRKDNRATLCAGSAICVIGFFEDHIETLSNPPVNDQPSRLNKTLEILSLVASDSQKQRQPFQFMWTNGKCQSEFAQAFDVGIFQMPTIVVYSPSKQRYATNIGLFDLDNTAGFLKSILSGKISTIPIDHVPHLRDECSLSEIQNDGANVIIEEDEEELGDLLNEILGDEDIQRRKLEAELKASKKSSTSTGTKKKKKSKKSKKKKKKTRDEL